jgi:hypothetical protein
LPRRQFSFAGGTEGRTRRLEEIERRISSFRRVYQLGSFSKIF